MNELKNELLVKIISGFLLFTNVMFVYYKVFQCLFFIMLIFSIQQVVLENLRFDCFILV